MQMKGVFPNSSINFIKILNLDGPYPIKGLSNISFDPTSYISNLENLSMPKDKYLLIKIYR